MDCYPDRWDSENYELAYQTQCSYQSSQFLKALKGSVHYNLSYYVEFCEIIFSLQKNLKPPNADPTNISEMVRTSIYKFGHLLDYLRQLIVEFQVDYRFHPWNYCLLFRAFRPFAAYLSQDGYPNSINILQVLNFEPFSFYCPEAYFSNMLRLAVISYNNLRLKMLTINEFPLLLHRCYQTAYQLHKSLFGLFYLDAPHFWLYICDNLCAPHTAPFSVLVAFLRSYEYRTKCTISQYLLEATAPLLNGELADVAADLLRICLLMCVFGYEFRTFVPKQAELGAFTNENQHFSFDFYIENLPECEDLPDPLETLMGPNEYQILLDDMQYDARLVIVHPAIYYDHRFREKGQAQAYVRMPGQFTCPLYKKCNFLGEDSAFDDIQLNIAYHEYSVDFSAIRDTIGKCRQKIKEEVKYKNQMIYTYQAAYYQYKYANAIADKMTGWIQAKAKSPGCAANPFSHSYPYHPAISKEALEQLKSYYFIKNRDC